MRYDALFRGRGDQNKEKLCYVTKICDPYTTVKRLFLVGKCFKHSLLPKARLQKASKSKQ